MVMAVDQSECEAFAECLGGHGLKPKPSMNMIGLSIYAIQQDHLVIYWYFHVYSRNSYVKGNSPNLKKTRRIHSSKGIFLTDQDVMFHVHFGTL